MLNNEEFSKRLQEVMDYYGLSASAFAERIGVQRSGISHILSGRNKPSLDFVMKVLEQFKEVDLYWLLNGKGQFPQTERVVVGDARFDDTPLPQAPKKDHDKIDRIVIFFKDGTFRSYNT